MTGEQKDLILKLHKLDLPEQTPKDDTGGIFVIPKIGSQTGMFYLASVVIEEHWTMLSCGVLGQERSLGAPEIAYLRNLFFNQEVVVVIYVPNHEACVRNGAQLFVGTDMFAPADGHMRVPPRARIR